VLGRHPGCHPIGMDGVHPTRRRASVWWLGSARRWRPARTRPAAVDNNSVVGLLDVISRRELSTLITCARFSTRGVSVIEGYLERCPSCYREQEGHRSIRVGVALRPLGHVGCWGSVPGRVVVWPPRCAQPPAPPMQLRPSRWRSSTAADHRWRPLVPCVYPAVVRPTDRAGHSVTGKHPVAAITAVRAVGVRLRGPKSLSASPASRGPNLSPIHTPTYKITAITAVSRRDDDYAVPALCLFYPCGHVIAPHGWRRPPPVALPPLLIPSAAGAPLAADVVRMFGSVHHQGS